MITHRRRFDRRRGQPTRFEAVLQRFVQECCSPLQTGHKKSVFSDIMPIQSLAALRIAQPNGFDWLNVGVFSIKAIFYDKQEK